MDIVLINYILSMIIALPYSYYQYIDLLQTREFIDPIIYINDSYNCDKIIFDPVVYDRFKIICSEFNIKLDDCHIDYWVENYICEINGVKLETYEEYKTFIQDNPSYLTTSS